MKSRIKDKYGRVSHGLADALINQGKGVVSIIVIGLDLARKGKHYAVAIDRMQEAILSRSVGSSPDDLRRLLHDVTEKGEDKDIHIVMEASGYAWLAPAQFFQAYGCRVYRIKAEKARDFRRYLHKHAKTDRIDAHSLAKLRFVEPRSLNELYIPDSQRFA